MSNVNYIREYFQLDDMLNKNQPKQLLNNVIPCENYVCRMCNLALEPMTHNSDCNVYVYRCNWCVYYAYFHGCKEKTNICQIVSFDGKFNIRHTTQQDIDDVAYKYNREIHPNTLKLLRQFAHDDCVYMYADYEKNRLNITARYKFYDLTKIAMFCYKPHVIYDFGRIPSMTSFKFRCIGCHRNTK